MGIIKSSRDSRLIVIQKLSDEIVNNSVTLQNDDDFFWETKTDTAYVFHLYMWITSPAAADIKININEANSYGQVVTRDSGGTTISNLNTDLSHGTTGAGQLIMYQGLLIQAVNASTVHVQWAQLAPVVGDTIMGAGSSLLVWRL